MLTPIEQHGPITCKRDDLFEIAGVRGGKVRTCWALSAGADGLVTAGSRSSPQANIVAHIAQHLGIPARIHTPTGELFPEILQAKECGAEIVQHPAGYNSVIIARAHADAQQRGWTEIPFGMECWEAVKQTRSQVENLPPEIKRWVVPVGSGMSLCGIVTGIMDKFSPEEAPKILGVQVGANPEGRWRTFMPMGWQDYVDVVPFPGDYHKPHAVTGAPALWLKDIVLDLYYEAKAAQYLQAGDGFWLVGVRATALL